MGVTPPHVRVLSWLSACALAALAALALQRALPPVLDDGVEPLPIAFATLDLPRPPQREHSPRVANTTDPSATITAPAASGVELRLWTYGARGEIVFADAEQFDRCIEARRRRREASDCPGAEETAVMTFDPAARRGIRIDPPRYRGGG